MSRFMIIAPSPDHADEVMCDRDAIGAIPSVSIPMGTKVAVEENERGWRSVRRLDGGYLFLMQPMTESAPPKRRWRIFHAT